MAEVLPVSFRIPPAVLARIDQDATAHGLDRTKYVLAKLQDQLGSIGLDHRMDVLEERMERMERMANLSY